MDVVEEVKARLRIEDVVGQYVDLKRSGSSLKGLCPFHSEKTPSFHVFPSTGTFHCFGCGQGGDLLTFVESHEKVDFREALHRLANRAGVDLPDERTRHEQVEAHTRLYQANEAAVKFFRDQLKTAQGKRAAAYLTQREISPQSQHLFGLGCAPDARRSLRDALVERGFSDEELVAAGLLMTTEDGASRDRFHGRLMFPIRDLKGRITGFGGRILGDGEPKYMNSPQTDIFDKSRSLFGIDQAAEAIRANRRALVVEGYVDSIRAHQAGFHDVVASLGTAITAHQLQQCSRLAPCVILALDPDEAGQAAAARTAISALAALPRRQQQLPDSLGRRMVEVGLTVDLRIARIPTGAGDPDELIAHDPDGWTKLVQEAIPAFEFYFDTVVRSVDRSGEGWRQEIIERVIPVIQKFPFAVGVQAAWVERLSEVTGIQSRLLQNRLAPASPAPGGKRPSHLRSVPKGVAENPEPPKRLDPEQEAENALLQILLTRPCPAAVVPALSELQLRRPDAAELLQRCLERSESGGRPALDGVSEEARELASRLETEFVDDLSESRVEPAIRLHIATIRLRNNRRRSDGLQLALTQIGPEDREAGHGQLQQLLEERLELEQQIEKYQRFVIAGREISGDESAIG